MSHPSNEQRIYCVAAVIDSGTRPAGYVGNPLHKGVGKMPLMSNWVARATFVMRLIALVAVVLAAVGLPLGSYWE